MHVFKAVALVFHVNKFNITGMFKYVYFLNHVSPSFSGNNLEHDRGLDHFSDMFWSLDRCREWDFLKLLKGL